VCQKFIPSSGREKQNKKFSKVPNTKSAIYNALNIKKVQEPKCKGVYPISLLFFYSLNRLKIDKYLV
jgi:hypothetical protein